MSDGQAGESSNQASTSNSTTRPVGNLRDAPTTQPGSKVIGNVLNRRPADGVAGRGGRGRMMFMPNQVVRRKGEDGMVEPGTASAGTSQGTSQGEGRGRGDARGRGDGRGRGRGRGGASAPVEMVASGPFALGPAANNVRRPTRITAGMSQASGVGGGQPHGAGLTDTAAPTIDNTRKLQKRRAGLEAADKEQYSDDEGVEIVDMDDVNELDWMAPDSLIRVKEEDEEKAAKKRDKLKGKIKDGSGKAQPKFKMDPEEDNLNAESLLSSRDASTVPSGEGETDDKLLANALDLSESEEEEELEDLVEDFLANAHGDDSFSTSQSKLYYFQFPRPFPTFELPTGEVDDVEMADAGSTSTGKGKQKVTFAEDTLSGDEDTSAQPKSKVKSEESAPKPSGGKIGQLEIYRSGLVKMRLGDGIAMEVTAATQPSFLQHAVYHDQDKKRLVVLGEVNRRFIVSPDIDILLEDMLIAEEKERKRKADEAKMKMDELIRMDD
ncbi:unnamed protein product [Rhizoctonia solani]|uniref:DNA-directed RNA polymerase III subunit RPC4 n=1 Tax=Rhizoctonia solani TaxID=456999 RepID=A0A8H3BGZ7_9AGAM|nr:unnamed protein product [Rhizoctonia solani]